MFYQGVSQDARPVYGGADDFETQTAPASFREMQLGQSQTPISLYGGKGRA